MESTVSPRADAAQVIVGLDEYVVLDAVDDGDLLTITVTTKRLEAPCPECGVFSARVKSARTQTVVDSPGFGRPSRLRVLKRALRCDTDWCARRSFTPATQQLPVRARITTRCRRQIGAAGRDRSVASIAAEYGVSWHTSWSCVAAAARAVIAARPARPVLRLGVDETRFTRTEKWLTGFVDLDTGDLLDVVPGRTSASVASWLNELSTGERAAITVVVTDPHAGYRNALLAGLADVTAVVDRFHVAQLAGRAVTTVRRRRIWEQADRRGRNTDPGWRARHDLLRRRHDLTPRGGARILAACRADTGTTHIEGELLWSWAAKEHLADIYDTALDPEHARRLLTWWYWWISEHPVPELVTLAETISAWEPQFLAYFDTRATNGRTEGINRIIKHVKRTGFGYRNTENYRLKILYRCTRLPSAVEPAERPPAAGNA